MPSDDIESQPKESVTGVDAADGANASIAAEIEGQGLTEGAHDEQLDINTADISKLAPEVQKLVKSFQSDYTRKMQKLSDYRKSVESLKSKAEALDKLSSYEPFVQWYQSQLDGANRVKPEPAVEITDEEYQEAQTNKAKFNELLRKTARSEAERAMKENYEPTIQSLRQQTAIQFLNSEIDRLGKKFADFDKVAANEAFDDYVSKYKNYETAYKVYEFDRVISNMDKKVEEAARNLMQKRKQSIAERPGGAVLTGSKVVKARNVKEALDAAFEAASKGEEIPAFERVT